MIYEVIHIWVFNSTLIGTLISFSVEIWVCSVLLTLLNKNLVLTSLFGSIYFFKHTHKHTTYCLTFEFQILIYLIPMLKLLSINLRLHIACTRQQTFKGWVVGWLHSNIWQGFLFRIPFHMSSVRCLVTVHFL